MVMGAEIVTIHADLRHFRDNTSISINSDSVASVGCHIGSSICCLGGICRRTFVQSAAIKLLVLVDHILPTVVTFRVAQGFSPILRDQLRLIE